MEREIATAQANMESQQAEITEREKGLEAAQHDSRVEDMKKVSLVHLPLYGYAYGIADPCPMMQMMN